MVGEEQEQASQGDDEAQTTYPRSQAKLDQFLQIFLSYTLYNNVLH